MATKTTDESIERTTGGPDLMRLFLDDLGRHPLLTAEEQITLAQRVEKLTEWTVEQS